MNKVVSRVLIVSGMKLIVESMKTEDASGVLELQQQAHINKSNVREKLSNRSENSFRKTGGIFNPLSRVEIENQIDNPEFMTIVAKNTEGRVLGWLWASRCNTHFKCIDLKEITYYKKYEAFRQRVIDEISLGRLLFFGDLINRQENRSMFISLALIHVMLSSLAKSGYSSAIHETYRVLRYEDQHGVHDVGVSNLASLLMQSRGAATRIGCFPMKTLHLDSFSVDISPQISYVNFEKSLTALKIVTT